MRMRQTLADIESAFSEQITAQRQHGRRLRKHAERRSLQRELRKIHKHGTVRFAVLVLTLIATAVIVTIVMFETLYHVMG
jgi:hypothetical protein